MSTVASILHIKLYYSTRMRTGSRKKLINVQECECNLNVGISKGNTSKTSTGVGSRRQFVHTGCVRPRTFFGSGGGGSELVSEARIDCDDGDWELVMGCMIFYVRT